MRKQHMSPQFGTLEYDTNDIIRFERGLLGMPKCRDFILYEAPDTAPIVWLLSLSEDGPELPLLNPAILGPEYSLDDIRVPDTILAALQCRDSRELVRYAIITAPKDIRRISMNLRTPVLLNLEAGRGIEWPEPGIDRKPVRCQIYRDLIAGRPEDRTCNIVLKRRANETIELGDEITITVLDVTDKAVRLSVTGPRSLHVSRGTTPVTPAGETRRAAEDLDVSNLATVMQMYRVASEAAGDLHDTLIDLDATKTNIHAAG